MTTLTLGYKPIDLDVELNADADFVPSVQRADDTDFPDGSVLKLVFSFRGAAPVEWVSEISGSSATWNVDKVDVNTVIAGRPNGAKLWLIDGSSEVVWASGAVTVNK